MLLQICFVIGERVDDELTDEIKAIVDAHYPDVVYDQLRVYHSGIPLSIFKGLQIMFSSS